MVLGSLTGFSQTVYLLPFNTIPLKNNLFVEQTEVSVGMWLQFYYYSYSLDSVKANKELLPKFDALTQYTYAYLFDVNMNSELKDPKQWTYEGKQLNIPFPKDSMLTKRQEKKYLKNLTYLKLPITNVSYEQVVKFCQWRSKINSEYRKSIGLVYEMEYTLPTKEQYLLYKDTSNIQSFMKRKKRLFSANCSDSQSTIDSKLGKQVLDVTALYSSSLGIYHTIGNVSEMTNIKNQAIGGSYLHTFKEGNDASIQPYQDSKSWLGFRCIVRYKTVNYPSEY